MKTVKLLHQDFGSGDSKPFEASRDRIVWTTCRRSLAFDWSGMVNHADAVCADDAHRILLEVVCGLRSPVLGETEVHGQYKQFLDEVKFQIPEYVYAELFTVHLQARAIRDQFLRGLGSQSYGSFARKKLRGQTEVTVWGAGHLATKVLPWLVKMPCKVNVWVRNLRKSEVIKSKFPQIHMMPANDVETSPAGALIVAAPIPSSELSKSLDSLSWTPDLILDFRSEGSQDPLPAEYEALSLNEIFAEIQSVKTKINESALAARECISRLVSEQSQFNEISHRSP